MKAYFTASLVAAALLATPFRALASCGTVEVSKGNVKITSGATKAVTAAPAGSKICSGDTIVAGADSRAKLKMEDGNELNISPDSQIVIEDYQYNPTENKKKVLLNVLKGKVRATTKQENMYNDKAKDGQANTFEVRTKTAVAGVRGTDFLTSFNPTTQTSQVVTFRGKVSFGLVGPNGTVVNAASVAAGQKLDLSVGKAPSAPINIPAKELDKTNSDTKSDVGAVKGAVTGTATAATGSANSGAAPAAAAPASGSTETSGATATAPASTTTTGASTGTSDSRTPSSTTAGTTVNAPATTTVTAPAVAPPTLAVPPIASNLPIVPVVPVVPVIPKCDICTAAQQTNKSANVNIVIKIKN